MSEYYTPPADVPAGTRTRSTKINDIIQATKDGFDALPGGLNETSAEITAARKGLTDLLAQVNYLQDQITALAAGNGPLAEYLAERFVLGNGFAVSTSATVLRIDAQDHYARFASFAFR